jgi:hypothetical protein
VILFGPVGDAARGRHSSASFDLIVGIAVLAITWIGYSKRENRKKNIWIAIGITAICSVFLYFGIHELFRW